VTSATDLSRANIILEELVKFEDAATDPVMQQELVAAFAAQGLVGDDPVNNPVSVIGAGKPSSNYKSGSFDKPSFGFGAKPLEPINPEPYQAPPKKAAIDYTGAIVGLVLGSLVLVAAAVWYVHFKPGKIKRDAPVKKGDDEEGLEMQQKGRSYSNTGVREQLAVAATSDKTGWRYGKGSKSSSEAKTEIELVETEAKGESVMDELEDDGVVNPMPIADAGSTEIAVKDGASETTFDDEPKSNEIVTAQASDEVFL